MARKSLGVSSLILLISTSTLAYPNHQQSLEYHKDNYGIHQQINQPILERKFAEKTNNIKKVALDDLDDVQSNDISQSSSIGGGGGFSWSNLLGMVMQMIFNPGAVATGPNKSDGLDDGVAPASPWANLLSVGLKILTAILGGGASTQSDGIDKVDNGNSPLQFINIVVNLLDALKTSFSHRSLAARTIGKKDSVSDAAIAGIAMAKGYVRSLGTDESSCIAKYMCQANNECSTEIGQNSLFCNFGSYAASFVLHKSTSQTNFDLLYEAGRRGRGGNSCEMGYLECNEIY